MFQLAIKVGSLPGESSAKDGMPVSIYPAGEILSMHMLRVFAIVRLNDALMPEVSAAFAPIMDKNGKKTVRMTSKYLDLDELAALFGNPSLAAAWRSKEIVPPQDGTKIMMGVLEWHDTEEKTWVVGDENAVASGSYTVGSGGDYANWNAAIADIAATLTDDLTFTQISDTTETGIDTATVGLGGYTLTITNQSPHNGNPTAGYKSTIDPAGTSFYGIGLWLTGTGAAEIENLNFKSASKTISVASYGIVVSSAGPDVGIHDCLLDLSNITANANVSGIFFYDDDGASASTEVDIWNNVITAGSVGTASFSGLRPTAAYSSVVIAENCTVKMSGDDPGIDPSGSAVTVRNCCVFGSTACFAGIATANGYNNASSDATAADVGWADGAGNQISIDVGDEFESTTSTDSNFVKVTDAGVCHDGGATVGIAENTLGIRGNARPHSPDVSIGADELGGAGSTSGSSGGNMMVNVALWVRAGF